MSSFHSIPFQEGGAHVFAYLRYMKRGPTKTFRISLRWIWDDLKKLYSAKLVLNKLVIFISLVLIMTVYAYDIETADAIKKIADNSALAWIFDKITFLGDGIVAFILAVGFGVFPATGRFGQVIFSTSIYTGLNVRILKIFLGRPRPGSVQPVISGFTSFSSHDSMPSGHAAFAFVLAVLLANRYPKYKWVFYSLATLVAVSRIVENMHWPADVIAGAIIGSLSASLATRCFRLQEKENRESDLAPQN